MSEDTDVTELIDMAATQLRSTLETVLGPASTSAVFSEPRMVGDDLVFTAAAWERGGGFGLGGGRGNDPAGSGGIGTGGGGGGGSQGRPVAVIRVGTSGIDVRPVLDLTRIGITVLLAAIGVWRALRPPR